VHQANRGYDAALDFGFARAAELACNYALTMDADGQHDPSVLNDFIRALQCGADVVAGVRDRRQRFAEHLFAAYTEGRWGIKDPLCGLKAYRMELGHFDTHRSIGTELLLYAARRKKRIDQVPVRTRARLDAPRFGNRLKGNLRILRALLRSIP
jgi:glycosyltransferase involved in cell wall biosynthesis